MPGSGKERRLTEQLILYWQEIRGERRMPSFEDIVPEDIEHIWQDCFLVEIDENVEVNRHHYTFLGKNICSIFGGDLTGASVLTLADNMASRYFMVAASKQPLVDESEFVNMLDEKIMYRQILLPIGPDDGTVDYIFGGMRCKQLNPS